MSDSDADTVMSSEQHNEEHNEQHNEEQNEQPGILNDLDIDEHLNAFQRRINSIVSSIMTENAALKTIIGDLRRTLNIKSDYDLKHVYQERLKAFESQKEQLVLLERENVMLKQQMLEYQREQSQDSIESDSQPVSLERPSLRIEPNLRLGMAPLKLRPELCRPLSASRAEADKRMQASKRNTLQLQWCCTAEPTATEPSATEPSAAAVAAMPTGLQHQCHQDCLNRDCLRRQSETLMKPKHSPKVLQSQLNCEKLAPLASAPVASAPFASALSLSQCQKYRGTLDTDVERSFSYTSKTSETRTFSEMDEK